MSLGYPSDKGSTALKHLLITVVCQLLDQVPALWNLLTPHAKLNLEAAL
jgi:hypothetical protein